MTAQWTLIASTTVASATTSVAFTSIGTYESYRLVWYSGDNAGSDYTQIAPNNAGSSLYSRGFFANTSGGSISHNAFSSYWALGVQATNNSANLETATNIIDIGFAQSTSIIKPFVGMGGWSGNMIRVSAGAWNNSGTAISSIYVKVGSSASLSIMPNSIFTLYGRNV